MTAPSSWTGEGREVDLTDACDLAEAVVDDARAGVDDDNRDLSLREAVTAGADWQQADTATRRLIRHVVTGMVEAEYGAD